MEDVTFKGFVISKCHGYCMGGDKSQSKEKIEIHKRSNITSVIGEILVNRTAVSSDLTGVDVGANARRERGLPLSRLPGLP